MKLLSLAFVAVFVLDTVEATDGCDCWTEWFDRDDPSGSGDWETLSHLREAHPLKICPIPSDIEFRTLSGLTAAEAGDTIFRADVSTGFVCRKADQADGECHDYKVRFKCYPPYCRNPVCWTKWYSRDYPSGSGDWEMLKSLREKYPGEICETPTNIEAVTTDTLTPAIRTGQIFHIYTPTQGFVCRNQDQKCDGSCRNYQVRFECPCAD